MNLTLLHQYPYLEPSKNGSLQSALLDVVEIQNTSFSLSHPIIALSDMQGIVQEGNQYVPLAEDVFSTLLPLLSLEEVLPPLETCVCVIAGDMFASTTSFKRGLSGNIDMVLSLAAHSNFIKVLTVLGNHDSITIDLNLPQFENLKVLDGNSLNIGDCHFAGVSGVMGNPNKPNRNDESMFKNKLKCTNNAEVMLLHEGPHLSVSQFGNPFITEQLFLLKNKLIISGHAHWNHPIGILGSNVVINTDARIVSLT